MSNKQIVIDFLKALEKEKSADVLERFYHPEVEQTEFPNAITKQTAVRNLTDLKTAFAKGRQLLTSETYEVK
jgi:hypothetical protein